MDALDLKAALAIAERAALAASNALNAHRGEWSGVADEIGREVKIDADKRAEEIIVTALQTETDFPILSEEAGWIAGADEGLFWAVDPLDGSVNYAMGYPHCAVSIALMRARAPLLGAVNCFALKEAFAGVVGQGATLNDRPIAVSRVAVPAKGILQTGIPSRMSDEPLTRAAFAENLGSWRKVRMIGSAASALACVACGRADAYHESGAMLWDVAGGLALTAAAGGQIALSTGPLDQPLSVRATNGAAAIEAHFAQAQ